MPIILDEGSGPGGDTLSTLLDEFHARGYQYIDDTRATRLINWAYRELCATYDWPFLEATATIDSGSTIVDVATVRGVNLSDGTPLPSAKLKWLAANVSDLATTGDPVCWYLEGTATFKTYPVTTDVLTIRYQLIPGPLTTGTDRVYIPAQFSNVLVDGAVLNGLKDDDDQSNRQLLKAEYDDRVAQMVFFYAGREGDGDTIDTTGSWMVGLR